MSKFTYISKECKTIKQAEAVKKRLQNKYSHVTLIRFPIYTDNGIYQFEVAI